MATPLERSQEVFCRVTDILDGRALLAEGELAALKQHLPVIMPNASQEERRALLDALSVLEEGAFPGPGLSRMSRTRLDRVRELLGFASWDDVHAAAKATGIATYPELVQNKTSSTACKLSFLLGETLKR